MIFSSRMVISLRLPNKMYRPTMIGREADVDLALFLELDIASQRNSVSEARKNLREALELFYETSSPQEIKHRLQKSLH